MCREAGYDRVGSVSFYAINICRFGPGRDIVLLVSVCLSVPALRVLDERN